ncbi:MAG TPA: hypothetical protein VN046_01410, partial [Stenotrophobium sp.]|nr:hypothetical protein [Stenotrophobium sp.]
MKKPGDRLGLSVEVDGQTREIPLSPSAQNRSAIRIMERHRNKPRILPAYAARRRNIAAGRPPALPVCVQIVVIF